MEPLGIHWEVKGPSAKPALLSRLASGEFLIADEMETGGNGWISERLAATWFGDGVLLMHAGETKRVWGVFGVEK